MLSIEDIYREIGKNIFICPLKIENFKDNSIDLTASKFAWTTDGEYIYKKDTHTIQIPKHKSACILTDESIYVTRKIGGSYYSRVSLVKRGLSHISTMLDPMYCGQSLIVVHNNTDSDININEGERLVSLAFHYLKTPIYDKTLSTPPSHIEKISSIDKECIYKGWYDENTWVNNSTLLIRHFKKTYLKEFEKNRNDYSQKKRVIFKLWSSFGRYIMKYFLIFAIIAVSLMIIDKYYAPSEKSNWASLILSIVICLVGLIANDIQKK